jgi:hypothetical protein
MVASDRTLRRFCQGAPMRLGQLLRHSLGATIALMLAFHGKDTRLDPPELQADFLAFEGDDGVIHMEFQGYSDNQFLDRLFTYHLNVALRYPAKRVRSFAVWLRKPGPGQAENTIVRGDITVNVQHVIVPNLNGPAMLADDLAYMAPGAEPGDWTVEELMLACARALQERNAGPEELAVAEVAAACRGRYKQFRDAMAQVGLEQPLILEDLVDLGFDQGIEKGREEGLRAGVYALADALGLEVDERRRAEIDAFNSTQLAALLDRLKRLRSFE